MLKYFEIFNTFYIILLNVWPHLNCVLFETLITKLDNYVLIMIFTQNIYYTITFICVINNYQQHIKIEKRHEQIKKASTEYTRGSSNTSST